MYIYLSYVSIYQGDQFFNDILTDNTQRSSLKTTQQLLQYNVKLVIRVRNMYSVTT